MQVCIYKYNFQCVHDLQLMWIFPPSFFFSFLVLLCCCLFVVVVVFLCCCVTISQKRHGLQMNPRMPSPGTFRSNP